MNFIISNCLCTGDNADPVLTQVRRSTRKTPNKYRRKSTVSRGSTSEENDILDLLN